MSKHFMFVSLFYKRCSHLMTVPKCSAFDCRNAQFFSKCRSIEVRRRGLEVQVWQHGLRMRKMLLFMNSSCLHLMTVPIQLTMQCFWLQECPIRFKMSIHWSTQRCGGTCTTAWTLIEKNLAFHELIMPNFTKLSICILTTSLNLCHTVPCTNSTQQLLTWTSLRSTNWQNEDASHA